MGPVFLNYKEKALDLCGPEILPRASARLSLTLKSEHFLLLAAALSSPAHLSLSTSGLTTLGPGEHTALTAAYVWPLNIHIGAL